VATLTSPRHVQGKATAEAKGNGFSAVAATASLYGRCRECNCGNHTSFLDDDLAAVVTRANVANACRLRAGHGRTIYNSRACRRSPAAGARTCQFVRIFCADAAQFAACPLPARCREHSIPRRSLARGRPAWEAATQSHAPSMGRVRQTSSRGDRLPANACGDSPLERALKIITPGKAVSALQDSPFVPTCGL
jgi:hypothetical protein